MQVSLVAILLLSAFVAVAVAHGGSEPPSDAHRARCLGIGEGSGCSGCRDPHVECEWCVDPHDSSAGLCGAKGWCRLETAEGRSENTIPSLPDHCPKLPLTQREDILHGRDTIPEFQQRHTEWHDPHYCEFHVQPWPVDRLAHELVVGQEGFSECNNVNTRLAVGQRKDIDLCLYSKLTKKRATPTDEVLKKLLTPARKECLRLYQSLLCTTTCPEYGVALDPHRFCHNVCEELKHNCDDDLLGCIQSSLPFDFKATDGCAKQGSTDCFNPNLTDQSGIFEYDLCFWGDYTRCKKAPNNDCKLSGSSPSVCCDSVYAPTSAGGWSHAYYTWNIASQPTGAGLPCEAVALQKAKDYINNGLQTSLSFGSPDCDATSCTVYADYHANVPLVGKAPSQCDQASEAVGCD